MKKVKVAKALKPVGKTTLEDPRIKKITEDIEKLRVRTAQNLVLIGRKLLQAKKLLEHGDWVTWLENKAGFNIRTAQRFMKLASAPQLSGLGVGKAELFLRVPQKNRAALLMQPLPLPGGKKTIREATVREVRTFLRANRETLGIGRPRKSSGVTAAQLVKSFQKIRTQLDRFDAEETKAFRKKQALVFDVFARVAELLWDDRKKITRFKRLLRE